MAQGQQQEMISMPAMEPQQQSDVPQGQPQGDMRQGGGQQSMKGKPYPGSPSEAFQFANNIMEELYRDPDKNPYIRAMSTMPDNIPQEKVIGMLAAKLVGDMLGQLRATGRKPALKIADGAIKTAVSELVEMGNAAGKNIQEDVIEPSIAIAADTIDKSSKPPGQPGQPGNPGAPGQQSPQPEQQTGPEQQAVPGGMTI